MITPVIFTVRYVWNIVQFIQCMKTEYFLVFKKMWSSVRITPVRHSYVQSICLNSKSHLINSPFQFTSVHSLQSMIQATVLMEMFAWWEAPISMRVEWRCASMTSGGQCVMTPGTTLMLLWSASSWDMEVSICIILLIDNFTCYLVYTDGRAYSNAHFGAGRPQ